jgi:gas vesicle protein
MSEGIDGKSMAVGILIGVAAGVAIGFLTAPKSGQETREMIKDKVVELKDKAESALSKVKEAACAKMGAGKEA